MNFLIISLIFPAVNTCTTEHWATTKAFQLQMSCPYLLAAEWEIQRSSLSPSFPRNLQEIQCMVIWAVHNEPVKQKSTKEKAQSKKAVLASKLLFGSKSFLLPQVKHSVEMEPYCVKETESILLICSKEVAPTCCSLIETSCLRYQHFICHVAAREILEQLIMWCKHSHGAETKQIWLQSPGLLFPTSLWAMTARVGVLWGGAGGWHLGTPMVSAERGFF